MEVAEEGQQWDGCSLHDTKSHQSIWGLSSTKGIAVRSLSFTEP